MTVQLSKQQIEQLSVVLAQVGLTVKAMPKPRAKASDWLSRVKAWKPETPAGRACKAGMLRHAAWGPFKGAHSYQVRSKSGLWLSEGDLGFAEAVAYQKQFNSKAKPADFDLYPGWYEGISEANA